VCAFEPNFAELHRLLKWLARIAGALFILLALFALGYLVAPSPPTGDPGSAWPTGWAVFFVPLGAALAFLIGWWRPLTGGLAALGCLTVASTTAVVKHDYVMWAVIVVTISILYLLAGWTGRKSAKRSKTTFSSAIVFMLMLSSCSKQAMEPSHTARYALEEAIESFYAAIEAGDVEARVALFHENAIMLPNHGQIIQGEGAVIDVIRSGDGAVFRIRDRNIERLDISGDLAYTVNTYSYSYHLEGAKPQWHKTKNVHIWRRDDAGNWKIQVDIWNSDVPMDAFDKE
jgi:ketosteroid isomerase-like protein